MVRLIKEGDPEAKIGNQFEELVNDNMIVFKEASLSELPSDWARLLVNTFLERFNVKWWLGDVKVDGAICIKVDDPFLQYLDIHSSDFFSWSTNDHHDGVHPDTAMVYLLNGEIGYWRASCT